MKKQERKRKIFTRRRTGNHPSIDQTVTGENARGSNPLSEVVNSLFTGQSFPNSQRDINMPMIHNGICSYEKRIKPFGQVPDTDVKLANASPLSLTEPASD
jgi:hypothetical protein